MSEKEKPEKKEVVDYPDSEGPPLPPDGGWGWVVVFASFMINVIVDGVCYTFAVFYIEFLDYFKENKSKTAWVGSMVPGVYLMMGPIVSALANKYGCRRVSMAGSVVASFAFFISSFSPNVDVLILTYGVLGGIGFGLIYLPAIVIVGFYFERKRAFATGIAVCGSGIGTFVFAPLSRLLLDIFGWKGSMWIISGIILNCGLMAALFRPLTVAVRKKKPAKLAAQEVDRGFIWKKIEEEKAKQLFISTGSMNNIVITRDNQLVDPAKLDCKERYQLLGTLRDSVSSVPAVGVGSMGNIENKLVTVSFTPSSPTVEEEVTFPNGGSPVNKLLENVKNMEGPVAPRPGRARTLSNSSSCPDFDDSANDAEEERRKDLARPMYRKDIFFSGSIMSIPQFQNSDLSVGDFVKSITQVPKGDLSLINRVCPCLPKSMTDVIGSMFDFSLLKSPTFSVLCMSSVLAMTGFFTPFVFITDRAMLIGVDINSATFLLSILGITNTCGRIVSGWMSDRSWVDCLFVNNASLIIAGAATMLSVFCTSHGLLIAYAALFGTCIAAFVSLRTIILVELLGLEKLTNSFGILLLFQGLASVIGTPITGWIMDKTESIDVAFYVAGALIALAGVICIPIRRLARWENRMKLRKEFFDEPQSESGVVEPEYVKVAQTESVV